MATPLRYGYVWIATGLALGVSIYNGATRWWVDPSDIVELQQAVVERKIAIDGGSLLPVVTCGWYVAQSDIQGVDQGIMGLNDYVDPNLLYDGVVLEYDPEFSLRLTFSNACVYAGLTNGRFTHPTTSASNALWYVTTNDLWERARVIQQYKWGLADDVTGIGGVLHYMDSGVQASWGAAVGAYAEVWTNGVASWPGTSGAFEYLYWASSYGKSGWDPGWRVSGYWSDYFLQSYHTNRGGTNVPYHSDGAQLWVLAMYPRSYGFTNQTELFSGGGIISGAGITRTNAAWNLVGTPVSTTSERCYARYCPSEPPPPAESDPDPEWRTVVRGHRVADSMFIVTWDFKYCTNAP